MKGPHKDYKNPEFIVGIDEAGRGPLAGPVAVGSVMAKASDLPRLRRVFKDIKGRDSKKLTSAERDDWFDILKAEAKSGTLSWRVSLVSNTVIDKKGISFAIRSGLSKSLYGTGVKAKNTRVLLDGSLKAPEEFKNQKTIIKGDEKELLISLASIAAKVTRDRYMCRLAKKFPEYGFEVHKGYGTKYHARALRTYGLTMLHRLSFCSKHVKSTFFGHKPSALDAIRGATEHVS